MGLNHRAIIWFLAAAAFITGAAMFLPALASLISGEYMASAAFASCGAAIAAAAALLARLIGGLKLRFSSLRPRDAIAAVTLCWLASSLLGAAPYMLCGVTGSMASAFFESASGFTTTGATCLEGLEGLPRGILLWRSLTGWLGGLEIIALVLGILPISAANQLSAQAESSVLLSEKHFPKSERASLMFYAIYLGATALLAAGCLIGGMGPFDALTHSMGVVSTSGFSNYSAGAAHFGSGFINWLTSAAMLLAALNFTLYYRLFTGRRRLFFQDEELRAYFAIFICSAALMSASLGIAGTMPGNPARSVGLAVFEASATLSTTGLRNADYTLWPPFCQIILLALMIIGGCSASPAGGLKIARVLIAGRLIRRNISLRLHPKAFVPIRLDGKAVPSDISADAAVHAMLYVSALILGTLVLSLSGADHISSFSAVAACIGNVGTGFGLAGPHASYALFPWPFKLFLCFLMIAGRLELTGALLMFTRQFWSNDR
ncbi:MAG: TrkH family potassium uptake protein [Clostridiales Family XIII bacterium]|jgi:trk system potassium uptake protein TrkH|nr:TrkH family potassium uptake protein [Clostridiales Family XIII bacterium]